MTVRLRKEVGWQIFVCLMGGEDETIWELVSFYGKGREGKGREEGGPLIKMGKGVGEGRLGGLKKKRNIHRGKISVNFLF